MSKKTIPSTGMIQLCPLLAYRESWKRLKKGEVEKLEGSATIPVHYIGEVRLIIKKAFRPYTESTSEFSKEDSHSDTLTTTEVEPIARILYFVRQDDWLLIGEVVQDTGNIPILLYSLRDGDMAYYTLLETEEDKRKAEELEYIGHHNHKKSNNKLGRSVRVIFYTGDFALIRSIT